MERESSGHFVVNWISIVNVNINCSYFFFQQKNDYEPLFRHSNIQIEFNRIFRINQKLTQLGWSLFIIFGMKVQSFVSFFSLDRKCSAVHFTSIESNRFEKMHCGAPQLKKWRILMNQLMSRLFWANREREIEICKPDIKNCFTIEISIA